MKRQIFVAYDASVRKQEGRVSADSVMAALTRHEALENATISELPVTPELLQAKRSNHLLDNWNETTLLDAELITVDALSTVFFSTIKKKVWTLFDPYSELIRLRESDSDNFSRDEVFTRLHLAISMSVSRVAGSLEAYWSLRYKHTNHIDYSPFPLVTNVRGKAQRPTVLLEINIPLARAKEILKQMHSILKMDEFPFFLITTTESREKNHYLSLLTEVGLDGADWNRQNTAHPISVHVVLGEATNTGVGMRIIDSWENRIPVLQFRDPQRPLSPEIDKLHRIEHGISGLLTNNSTEACRAIKRLLQDRDYNQLFADRARQHLANILHVKW